MWGVPVSNLHINQAISLQLQTVTKQLPDV